METSVSCFLAARHNLGTGLIIFLSSNYTNVFVGDAVSNPIAGTSFDDWIDGDDGRDNIFGAAGDDYIIAGSGFDWWVRGGSGSDVFQFGLGDQDVKIADWEDGQDLIALAEGVAYTDLTRTIQGYQGFQSVIYTTAQGDRLIFDRVDPDMIDEDDFVSLANPNAAPVAQAASAETNEDTALTGQLVATDVDGDDLTYAANLAVAPSNGTVTITSDGSYSYTPNADYFGDDSFGFTVDDGNGGTSAATVTVTIDPVNDAPIAQAASAETNEDTALAGQLVATDVDGDDLTYAADPAVAPSNGTVTITSDGSYSYTPNEDYFGDDSFGFTVDDGNGGTSAAIITVTVDPVNDAPRAEPQVFEIETGGTFVGQLAAIDVDGDGMTFAAGSNGVHNGTVQTTADGAIEYTPEAQFSGRETFDFTVTDSFGASTTQTASVLVGDPKLQIIVTMGQSLTQGATWPNREIFSGQSVDPNRVLTIDIGSETLLATGPGSALFTASGFGGFTALEERLSETHSSSMLNRIVHEYDNNGQIAPTLLHINVGVSGASILQLATLPENSFSNVEDALAATNDGDLFAIAQESTHLYYGNNAGNAEYLKELSAGPVAFGNFQSLLDLAHNEATELGYQVEDRLLVNWIQGQADNNGGAEIFGYQQVLEYLINNVDTFAEDTYGGSVETLALVSQHRGYGDKSVAIAQSEFVANNDFAHVGAVEYQFEASQPANAGVDLTHLSAEGYYMLGQTLGLNAYNLLTGQPDEGITLSSVEALGNTEFLVTFSGLEGSLVDDPRIYSAETGLVAPSHFGFGVYSSLGFALTTLPTILDAQIVGDNQVSLTLSDALSTSSLLYLGRNDEDLSNPDFIPTNGQGNTFGGSSLRDSEVFMATSPTNGSTLADANIYEYAAIQTVEITPYLNVAPTVTDIDETIDEDTVLTGQINGSDPDGDPLTYRADPAASPAHGVLEVNSDGSFSYSPELNFAGEDIFGFIADDGFGGTTTGTVSVTVDPINDAPAVITVDFATAEDTDLAGQITAFDAEGDPLVYVLDEDAQPVKGTLDLSSNGTFIYTPNADFNGTDSFGFSVDDGNGGVNLATVTIAVTPENDVPVAVNSSIELNEDITASGQLEAQDIDNTDLTYTADPDAAPTNGTVVINTDGTFSYVPGADYVGSDSFGFTVDDGSGGISIGTVTFTVAPVNDAPALGPNTSEVDEDTILNGQLSATDAEGDVLTYQLDPLTSPTNGRVIINADGSFDYIPNADFVGDDTFGFTVDDGNGGTSVGTQIITVLPINDAPIAESSSALLDEDTVLTGQLIATDVDGDLLTFVPELATPPTNGTVTINSDGSYSYVPNADFSGNDQFEFTVFDSSGESSSETITITVDPVNDAPLASDFSIWTNEETLMSGQIEAVDTEGDPISFILDPTSVAQNGVVTLTEDGNYTYAPDVDFNGADSFGFLVDDGTDTTTRTVFVTVDPVNDAPTVDMTNVQTTEDVAVTGQIIGADADGDALTYQIDVAALPSSGTATVDPDGTYSYVPAPNVSGIVTFGVVVSDNKGGIATQTIAMIIDPENDNPVALNGSNTTDVDTALAGQLISSDIDSITLNFVEDLLAPATNGLVVINADGSFTYTPNAGFTGSDTFGFIVSDGDGGTVTATQSIYVGVDNTPPETTDMNLSVAEDGAFVGQLLATDANSDTLSYQLDITALSQNGSVIVNTDGSFSFTPNSNYTGLDSFGFVVADGNGGTAAAVVNFAVDPTNDAPDVMDASGEVAEDNIFNGQLQAIDIDGDVITFQIDGTNMPEHGTSVVTADGSFSYTPIVNFVGVDTFGFTVEDESGAISTGTVSIAVVAENDAPIAITQSALTDEDTPINGQLVASDADGDILSFDADVTVVPANGIVVVNSDGTYTYTPNQDFAGMDTFGYRVSDGRGGITNGVIAVTVAPVNDAPTAVGGSVTTAEDMAVLGQLVAMDIDGDLIDFELDLAALAEHGTAVISLDGSYVYTPVSNFAGEDNFGFIANDGNGATSYQTIAISVTPVNDAPAASGATISTNEDETYSGLLTAIDVDGDTLSYLVDPLVSVANGALVINPDGSFSYTPMTDFTGQDSFDFMVEDALGQTSTATVSITIDPVNDAPVALTATIVMDEDTVQSGQLSAVDIDSASLSFSLDSLMLPVNGTVTVDVSGSYMYTPNPDFAGQDSFGFVVDDGAGGTSTETVSITIKDDFDPADYSNQFFGDEGLNPIVGTDDGDFISGFGERDNIFGAGGNDYIIAGAGNDWYVRGGSGADIFEFGLGDEGIGIADWEDGLDKIALVDGLAYDDLIRTEQTYNNQTSINFRTTSGDRLILSNVNPAEIDADDFILINEPVDGTLLV